MGRTVNFIETKCRTLTLWNVIQNQQVNRDPSEGHLVAPCPEAYRNIDIYTNIPNHTLSFDITSEDATFSLGCHSNNHTFTFGT